MYLGKKSSLQQKYALLEKLNQTRTEDFARGNVTYPGGLPEELPEGAPWFLKDYMDYYKTNRGYHARSANCTEGRLDIAKLQFINMPTASFTNEIRNAVLIIHGEKAHSCYFSKDEYKKMTENCKYTANKELMIIPDAVHTDLYDNLDVIPFDKIEEFLRKNL